MTTDIPKTVGLIHYFLEAVWTLKLGRSNVPKNKLVKF